MQIVYKTSMFIALISASVFSAYAQEQKPRDADPVHLFNEICYTQVPDVGAIQEMAKRFAWVPMREEGLKRFSSVESPQLLEGWDIRLSERIYRLGLVRTEPGARFVEAFPEMADGVATSCTMVLDGLDDAQTITERMNVLIGKPPSSTEVPEDQLLTTTWSGGTDMLKVFVFLKTDAIDRANLINVTIIERQQ